jgi:hypothetical protein
MNVWNQLKSRILEKSCRTCTKLSNLIENFQPLKRTVKFLQKIFDLWEKILEVS